MLQSATPSETTIPCNVKAIAMYLVCKTCLISGDVTTLDEKFFMQLIINALQGDNLEVKVAYCTLA